MSQGVDSLGLLTLIHHHFSFIANTNDESLLKLNQMTRRLKVVLIKIENQKGTEKPTNELGLRLSKASEENFHIRPYFNDRFVYKGSLDRKL